MIPLYWPAYALIKMINPFFFPLTLKGRENVPARGAFIAACNHISNFDPPLVSYAVGRPIYHIAKKSLFANKVFGLLLYGLGSFPIKREGSDLGAMRECLRKLKAGQPLALFPTGTRVVGEMQVTPKAGVGFLAVKGQVPVIPIKIAGTDMVLPKGSKMFHKHPVKITIGSPIYFSSHKDYDQIAAEILQKINAL